MPEGQSLPASLPGVSRAGDLHVWAMGTWQIALSAHVVMPHGGGHDDFLPRATTHFARTSKSGA